jgi:hypothetical protein
MTKRNAKAWQAMNSRMLCTSSLEQMWHLRARGDQLHQLTHDVLQAAAAGVRSAVVSFQEVRDYLSEGARFYTSLQEAVSVLQQHVGDFCLTRRIQRYPAAHVPITWYPRDQLSPACCSPPAHDPAMVRECFRCIRLITGNSEMHSACAVQRRNGRGAAAPRDLRGCQSAGGSTVQPHVSWRRRQTPCVCTAATTAVQQLTVSSTASSTWRNIPTSIWGASPAPSPPPSLVCSLLSICHAQAACRFFRRNAMTEAISSQLFHLSNCSLCALRCERMTSPKPQDQQQSRFTTNSDESFRLISKVLPADPNVTVLVQWVVRQLTVHGRLWPRTVLS